MTNDRMLKAALVAALGILLLLPTFNALNNSYVQNVPPPPWIPTPSTIPNVTPPPDFKPPTNMKPPPDFDASKYKGQLPPGGCPPPIITLIPGSAQNVTMNPQDGAAGLLSAGPGHHNSLSFTPPNGTFAVVGFVNLTNWQGQNFTATVSAPGGIDWSGYGNDTLAAKDTAQETLTYNSYEVMGHRAITPGNFQIAVDARAPFLSGSYSTVFYSIIPCGGLLAHAS